MDKYDIDLAFPIPVDLLAEFKQTHRLVIKWPWIIGIPVPDFLINKDLITKVRDMGFEVMLVPTKALH
jgi:hypothetical protein